MTTSGADLLDIVTGLERHARVRFAKAATARPRQRRERLQRKYAKAIGLAWRGYVDGFVRRNFSGVVKYSEDQPRDERGRWSAGGGAVEGVPTDYRGRHHPVADYGARGHDLTQLVGPDVYDHPEWYDAHEPGVTAESISQIRAMRGDPHHPVTIYRAVPTQGRPFALHPEDPHTINPGDWVTLSHAYAQMHGESNLTLYTDDDEPQPGEGYNKSFRILVGHVWAEDIVWPGDDLNEWGYFPQGNSPKDKVAKAAEWASLDIDWRMEERELTRALEPVLRDLAIEGYRGSREDVLRVLSPTAPDPRYPYRPAFTLDERQVERIRRELGNRIVRVSASNREKVRQYVEDALHEGLDQRGMQDGLREEVQSWAGSWEGREKAIALTESAAAYNLGSLLGYRESGIVDEVVIYDGEGTDKDPEWCGWTSHDDEDKASGSTRTLEDAHEYPTAHPNCQRSWAPVVIPPSDIEREWASPEPEGETEWEVLKHGDHDQSTHGSWARGGGEGKPDAERTTVKDIESKMADLISGAPSEVALGNMDVQTATELADTLVRLDKRFPGAVRSITRIAVEAPAEEAEAVTIPIDPEAARNGLPTASYILLDTVWEDPEKLWATHEMDRQANWGIDPTSKGTLTHEFAHVMEFAYPGVGPEWVAEFSRLAAKDEAGMYEIPHSGYAAASMQSGNLHEVWAEAFTEVMLDKPVSDLSMAAKAARTVLKDYEVAKHGDHDQSSHGNWSRGGSETHDLNSATETLLSLGVAKVGLYSISPPNAKALEERMTALAERFPTAMREVYAVSGWSPTRAWEPNYSAGWEMFNPRGTVPFPKEVGAETNVVSGLGSQSVLPGGYSGERDRWHPGHATITLNADVFGSDTAMEDYLHGPGREGWLANPTPEGVIDHEFGHVFEGMLNEHDLIGDPEQPRANMTWMALAGVTSRAADDPATLPSGYARAAAAKGNTHEVWAEGFSEALSPKPDADLSPLGKGFRDVLSSPDVLKHGDHDQSDHGNWARGGAGAVDGGEERTDSPAPSGDHTAPPQRAHVADADLSPAREQRPWYENAVEATIHDRYGLTANFGYQPSGADVNIPDSLQRDVLDTLETLHRDGLIAKGVDRIAYSIPGVNGEIEPSRWADFSQRTYEEGAAIRLNVFKWNDEAKLREGLSAAEKVGHLADGSPEGVINHEMAHGQYDAVFTGLMLDRLGIEEKGHSAGAYQLVPSEATHQQEERAPGGMLDPQRMEPWVPAERGYRGAPSSYAYYNAGEFWAESFAEARTSRPTEELSAAGRMTREYLADPDGVRQRLKEEAQARFEQVGKHGDHDQSSHGNWATGGGEEATGLTESPAFREWFAGSVVTNEDGSPKVMYHAGSGSVLEFRPYSHFGTAQAAADRNEDMREFSAIVTGGGSRESDPDATYGVYLDIKNPLRMPDLASIDSDSGEPIGFDLHDPVTGEDHYPRGWEGDEAVGTTLLEMGVIDIDEFEEKGRSNDGAFELLEEKGYDGIVYNNVVEDPGSDSYIIFHPEQVKVADIAAITKHGDHDQSSHGNWAHGGIEVGVSRDRPSLGGGERHSYAEVVAGRSDPVISEAHRQTIPDLKRIGVAVEEQRDVAGVFEGGGEPSLMLELGKVSKDDIDLTGAYLVRRNEQDSVIVSVTGPEMQRLGLEPNANVYRVSGLPTDAESRGAIFDRLKEMTEIGSYDEENGVVEVSLFTADAAYFEEKFYRFTHASGGTLDIIPAHTRWYFQDDERRDAARGYLSPADDSVLITADEVRAAQPERGRVIGPHRVEKARGGTDRRGGPPGAGGGPPEGSAGARLHHGAGAAQEGLAKHGDHDQSDHGNWARGGAQASTAIDAARTPTAPWTLAGRTVPEVGDRIHASDHVPQPSVPAGALPVGYGADNGPMASPHTIYLSSEVSEVEEQYHQSIRGDEVISPQDSRIPDTVYHVTSNLPAVYESGYLRAGGKGGLGGDDTDRIVSMTIDHEIATQLAEDMRLAAVISNTPKDDILPLLDRVAESEGWMDRWRQSTTYSTAATDEYAGRRYDSASMGYSPHEWGNMFFSSRYYATGQREPLLYDDLPMDPLDIGVVAIPKDNLDNGALLVDFDLHNATHGLQEIRSYGDVPLRGAVVTKFNPYHDERGRFTSADGGGEASLSGYEGRWGESTRDLMNMTMAEYLAPDPNKPPPLHEQRWLSESKATPGATDEGRHGTGVLDQMVLDEMHTTTTGIDEHGVPDVLQPDERLKHEVMVELGKALEECPPGSVGQSFWGAKANNEAFYGGDIRVSTTEEGAANQLVKGWTHLSETMRDETTLIQAAVQDVFGIESPHLDERIAAEHGYRPPPQNFDEDYDERARPGDGLRDYAWGHFDQDDMDVTRVAVRDMYERTQKMLADAGVEEVTLYRGISDTSTAEIAALREMSQPEVATNPATSWTTDEEVAKTFARGDDSYGDYSDGVVLVATFPRERILSTPKTGMGCLGESEVVVLGGIDDKVAVRDWEGAYSDEVEVNDEGEAEMADPEYLAQMDAGPQLPAGVYTTDLD